MITFFWPKISSYWLIFVVLFYSAFFLNVQLSYFAIDFSLSGVTSAILVCFGALSFLLNKSVERRIAPLYLTSLLFVFCSTIAVAVNFADVGVSLSLASFYVGNLAFFYIMVLLGLAKKASVASVRQFFSLLSLIYGINLILSALQLSMYNLGLIDKMVFWENPALNTVIFPDATSPKDPLRPPGLFTSAGGNAAFSFLYFLGYVFFSRRKSVLIEVLLFMLTAILIYFCLTRKIWLSISFVYLFFLWYFFLGKRLISAVFGFSLTGVLAVFGLVGFMHYYSFGKLFALEGKFNADSLISRFDQWSFYYSSYLDGASGVKSLFGLSVVQEFFDRYSHREFVLVDNFLLSIYLFAGITGCILFMLFWGWWLLLGIKIHMKWRSMRVYNNPGLYIVLVWFFFSLVSMFSNFFNSLEGAIMAVTAFTLSIIIDRGESAVYSKES